MNKYIKFQDFTSDPGFYFCQINFFYRVQHKINVKTVIQSIASYSHMILKDT